SRVRRRPAQERPAAEDRGPHAQGAEMRIIAQDDAILAAIKRNMADAARWRTLRALMGYVENGTDETITLSQVDATKEWSLRIGTRPGRTSYGALDFILTSAAADLLDEEGLK